MEHIVAVSRMLYIHQSTQLFGFGEVGPAPIIPVITNMPDARFLPPRIEDFFKTQPQTYVQI